MFVALRVELLTFLIWLLGHESVIFALTAAASAIVIACPNAMVLATITVSVGRATRTDVLLKNASTLGATAGLQTGVSDKIDTLRGSPP